MWSTSFEFPVSVRVLALWLWKGVEHSRRASCVVATNTGVDVDISEIQPVLLSVDTVLEFSLPGPSFVYVGGPDADSSAVYWNVGSCRCQNTGQESPSCCRRILGQRCLDFLN